MCGYRLSQNNEKTTMKKKTHDGRSTDAQSAFDVAINWIEVRKMTDANSTPVGLFLVAPLNHNYNRKALHIKDSVCTYRLLKFYTEMPLQLAEPHSTPRKMVLFTPSPPCGFVCRYFDINVYLSILNHYQSR